MKNHTMLEISKWYISTINYHGSSKIFTSPPNLITHLIVNSLKKVKEKNQAIKSNNFIGQFHFFHIQLHVHLQLRFIIANQVEKMSHGVQWPMNHNSNHIKNYIFIYFGIPPKMNDINVLFIQIDISHKFKLHMQLQIILQSFM